MPVAGKGCEDEVLAVSAKGPAPRLYPGRTATPAWVKAAWTAVRKLPGYRDIQATYEDTKKLAEPRTVRWENYGATAAPQSHALPEPHCCTFRSAPARSPRVAAATSPISTPGSR